MKNNIFIPTKINVGFQNRNDTYTKKLAYVIYYDVKGKLRKESSWNSWRNKEIPNVEFENVPTSNFVLNKKVGDYDSGWNHRHAYVRIYDPRNFEFEISVENLLYILENTNSIKGKGLEGEFVYAWDGKDLVLLPTSSPDYKSITEYNKVLHNGETIKAKDLKIGATYLNKNNSKQIYLGKFDKWESIYYPQKHFENKGKQFWFATKNSKQEITFNAYSSISWKFIKVLDENCIEDYAELFDKLEHQSNYSPIDSTKDVFVNYTFDEFVESVKSRYWGRDFIDKEYKRTKVYFKESENAYYKGNTMNGYYTKDIQINIKEFFNEFKPVYIEKYLANGNYYNREY